jgi:hypothetical protein
MEFGAVGDEPAWERREFSSFLVLVWHSDLHGQRGEEGPGLSFPTGGGQYPQKHLLFAATGKAGIPDIQIHYISWQGRSH